MKTYTVEWTESTRYRVTIKAPDNVAARETFWWFVHDGTVHDRSVEIDEGGEGNVVVAEDRDRRSPDFTYKEYLEAQ